MFNQLRIAARLMLGFGILVLIIAGISGFSTYSSQSAQTTFNDVIRLKNNEVLNQRAQKRIFEGRLYVWMGLATDDQSFWTKADAAFKSAHQWLDEAVALTIAPDRLSAYKTLITEVANYEAAATKLKVLRGKNVALDTPEGEDIVGRCSDDWQQDY